MQLHSALETVYKITTLALLSVLPSAPSTHSLTLFGSTTTCRPPAIKSQPPLATMAVIDILPGVQIELKANGTALKEYEDHNPKEGVRTVTRYVEVISGQEFVVSIKLLPNFVFRSDCVLFDLHADGGFTDTVAIGRAQFDSGGTSFESQGRTSGDWLQRYRFATLETGEITL